MKKVFLGILIALVVSSSLLYFTAPDRSSPVPVLYWVTQDDPVKRETISLFKEWLQDEGLPPLEIKIDNSNADATKKLTQGLSGVGADLFDVYTGQGALFASSGMLHDVTDQAVAMGFGPDQTYPSVDSIFYEGRQYGFPRNVGVFVNWINTEAFAKYGIPEPDHRWTWDDFERIGKAFVTAANPPGTRERSYFMRNVSISTLRRGLGLSIFNETMTRCILDDPRNAEVMRRYKRWVTDLRLIPTTAEQGAMAANSSRAGDGYFYLFTTGRYAMLNVPRWALIRLRPMGKVPFRIVEPFHSGFPNSEMGAGMVSVYEGSKYKKEATLFLKFLTTKRFNLLVIRSGDSLPPVPKYINTEEFLKPVDHPDEWEAHKVFARVGPEIGIGYARSPFVLLGIVNREDTKVSNSVIAGRISPEDAGKELAQLLNSEIDRTLEVNKNMRQKYDDLVKLQQQIDELRANGEPVPLEWISNPFHRVYYKAQGWLAKDSQS